VEIFRLFCYALGLMGSLVLAGQLFRIKHPLARLLAVAMIAWALNCITLLLLLYLMVSDLAIPPWRDAVTTVNALLLALIPAVLYVWFLRENGAARG